MLDQVVTMRNFFADRRVLITGSAGSLGHELKLVFRNWGLEDNLVCVDINPRPGEKDFCVDLSSGLPNLWFPRVGPFDTVFHLAADKHAPAGELHARQTSSVNIDSTLAVLDNCSDADIVFASTCKAADPETVYGASKLIGERIVLQEKGNVARFYNVPETAGNVFEFWEQCNYSIPYTNCNRYFISRGEAVGLLLATASLPSGRYTVSNVVRRNMREVAEALYPDRELTEIEPRRGDRITEPLCAKSEEIVPFFGGVSQIVSQHDQALRS